MTENLSLLKSSTLRSILPFTEANKKCQTLLNKKNIKKELDIERNRIRQLEMLFAECDRKKQYDSILKQLLLDSIDSEPSDHSASFLGEQHKSTQIPLDAAQRYFQRLKLLEENSGNNQNPNQSDSIQSSTTNMGPEKAAPFDIEDFTHDQHPCSWRGISEKGEPLHCINVAIFHPWKMYVSQSTGDVCPLSTGFCIFHQKFCLDTTKRHTATCKRHSLLHRNRQYEVYPITIPNQYGLCKECLVLKNGPPLQSQFTDISLRFCHVPGVRKLVIKNTGR